MGGYETGYFGLAGTQTIHVRVLGASKTLCGRKLNYWQFCSRARKPEQLSYLEPWRGCKTCRRIVGG